MRNFLNRYGKLHLIAHTMIFLVALIVANSVIQLTLMNMAHAETKITIEPREDQPPEAMSPEAMSAGLQAAFDNGLVRATKECDAACIKATYDLLFPSHRR